MKRVLLCHLLALTLTACAAAPDSVRYFVLSETESQPRLCAASVGIVNLPGYLKRADMAVQRSGNEVAYASAHRWAEPLDESVARVLRGCFEKARAPIVDVEVLHLHGSTSGRTFLEADWQTRSDGAAHNYKATVEQPTGGYDAMVDAQRALLHGFCESICNALSNSASATPPP